MTLVEAFNRVYVKFKLNFYRAAFMKVKEREFSLTTVESFCMEIIYAMNRPTVNEFASFIDVSSPNAAYKVNSLIKKGYIKKVRSENDKREYHLEVTQKYIDYYNMSFEYVKEIMKRTESRLSEDETEFLKKILGIMAEEMSREVPFYRDPLENEKNK